MDVDDEEQLKSIATTITNLRKNHSKDSTTASAWASGSDPWSTSNIPDAIVVFDTNVLISHLNFVQRLIDTYGTEASKWPAAGRNKGRKPLIFFLIPWVVVQELDGLKIQGRGGSELDLSDKARRAVKYLEDELVKPLDQRRIRGQKLTEHIETQQVIYIAALNRLHHKLQLNSQRPIDERPLS